MEWRIKLSAWPADRALAVPRHGREAARIGHPVEVSVGDEVRTGVFIDLRQAADGTLELVARLDE